MSFDSDAQDVGISGADLVMLVGVFANICSRTDPTVHNEVGRRLIRMFLAGLREPSMLMGLASSPGRPTRKPKIVRTLQSEIGIMNTNDM
jgi:hypothetical protein